jgi:tetratricopeptide (TPR) repeat protein/tRNA A-37 threonylcarbamoyl transferase component Bud32
MQPTRPYEDSAALPTARLVGKHTHAKANELTAGIERKLPQIAGYEILEELGRGGMGVVYKARHVKLDRVVALKMILAGGQASRQDHIRFLTEARAVAAIHHPGIIQVYEIAIHDGLPYFAMEFCEGGSLASRLSGTPLPPREAAHLVEQIARAVQAAHDKGIVHRDLKPGNALLDAAGQPKVTDFGLARKIEGGSGLTHTGAVLGTPSYMAPEQARGSKTVGVPADVYALGAVLYECLTGRPPFKAATHIDTVFQVLADEPVPPSRLNPQVPRDLETICLKCLEKDLHRRYTSAAELGDDLQRFLDCEPIHGRRVRLWERGAKWVRRRPTAAALIGVLVAVGLALPFAAIQFSAQLAQRREAEQKRLDEARAEVHDLHVRGQTAGRSEDWTQAERLLDRALDKIDAEPSLADLREAVEAVRAPVKARLAALDTYQRFVRDRDDALFHATLAGGENLRSNRKTAVDRAHAALAVVGLSVQEGSPPLFLSPSFTPREKAEITSGSYALLLMLAEIEARRLPQQTTREHHEQLRRALALLNRADALGVRTRAIHLRRARYLTLLGDVPAAGREKDRLRALAESNLDPQDRFLVGHEFYSQGNLTLANQEFRRALQLDAAHFWTHYFLGICCVTAGKPDVAVAHLTICQSQQPKVIWIYLLRGFALGQMGDYKAAEADFDQALALSPSPATLYVLYNNRGVMRVGQKGARTKGLEDLKRAVALRPDQYQAHASLAEAHGLDSRLDDAGRHLDKAIAVAGRDGDLKPATLALLHHRRARLHLQRGDRAAAVRDLKEAARLAGADRPLRARVDADRGRVLHLQERFPEALAAYDAALKADPGRVDALRWRGEVLLVQRRYPEAAEAFDAHLAKGGVPSAAVYRQRGLTRAKLGQHWDAIDDYSRALEAGAGDAEKAPLYLYRGREYLTVDALRAALRDFKEALRLDPESADACLGCAYVRVKLRDPQAVEDAEKAVKRQPKEPRLWHGAARVYAQAALLLHTEPGRKQSQARVRDRYQQRAVVLLRKALDLVPAAERQTYWRENVVKDASLASIRLELAELRPHVANNR